MTSVEWDPFPVGRLRVGYGVQAYARRERSDVLVGFDDRLFPVFDEAARRTDAVGAAYTVRIETRLGPVRVGGVSGGLGLGIRRTSGGTREDGDVVRAAAPGDEGWRLAFRDGSTRLYIGIEL